MTLGEYKEIIEFVQKHHRAHLYIPQDQRPIRKEHFPKLPDMYGFGIKYIDSTYDSRDMTIWSITFRRGLHGVRLAANYYVGTNEPPDDFKYTTLYDWCLAYLTGDFKPTDEFYVDLRDK